jgi:hypothetical protein
MSMAQHVRDLLESCTALNQPPGQCVAQDMGTANTLFKSTALCCVTYSITHDIRIGWRVDRWTVAYE